MYIVNRNKLRSHGSIVPLPFVEGSNLYKLYKGIANNTFQSDEEAANAIFGTLQADSNYRKLKTNLTKRLINALFFIDLKRPSYTDRQRAHQECHKNWAAVKILISENAREAAVQIAKMTLSKAEKYEFTQLCLDIVRTLRLHYGAMIGDEKSYQHYNHLYQKYRELYLLENQAEEYYAMLLLFQSRHPQAHQEIKEMAARYWEELRPALATHCFIDFLFYCTLIRLTGLLAGDHYQEALEVCEEVIRQYEQKPFVARIPLEVLQYQKIISLIQLRQINQEDFIRLISSERKFLKPGTNNWYRFLEAYIILGLHSRHYQQAYQVLVDALTHKRFEFLPAIQQEYWKILEMYFLYLYEAGKITPVMEGHKFPKFRLRKFQNEMLLASKDKSGLNILVLITELLFLVSIKKSPEVAEQIEAIEQYCNRHVKKSSRVFYFIKMLLTLPKYNFDKKEVDAKSRKYLAKLQQTSSKVVSQTIFLEILLFEDLWQIILDRLHRKPSQTQKSSFPAIASG